MKTRYATVVEYYLKEIKEGRLEVSTRLPSEQELAVQHGVSRATIRAALARLEEMGLVSRRRGAGTRIVSNRPSGEFQYMTLPIGDIMQYASGSRRVICEMQDVVADNILAERLDGIPGRHWLHVSQMRFDPNEQDPVCWTDLYVDAAYAGIQQHLPDYEGLVCDLIAECYNVVALEIQQTVKPIFVPEEIALALESTSGALGLQLSRYYYDAQSRLVEAAISIFPSERFTYRSHFRRGPQRTSQI